MLGGAVEDVLPVRVGQVRRLSHDGGRVGRADVERLLGEPEALTSPLAREVLGERVLRPLEKNGSPYIYLVFARDRTVSERRPPTPFAAVP